MDGVYLFLSIFFALFQTYNLEICTPVFITLKTDQVYKSYLYRIEMNWDFECGHNPYCIGLYSANPETNKNLTIKRRSYVKDHPKLQRITDVTLNDEELQSAILTYEARGVRSGPFCFKYWIASFDENDKLLQVNCLKLHPTWMDDNKEYIKNTPLSKLLIPGTYHSSLYNKSRDIDYSHLHHQTLFVQNQLFYGIRYIHFDVSYSKTPGEERDSFYASYFGLLVELIFPVLMQIRTYAEEYPKEIIIVDFDTLYLNDKQQLFVALLLRDIGDLVVPYQQFKDPIYGPTPSEIWDTNKSIIITYGDSDYGSEIPRLWPPTMHMWDNNQNIKYLQYYVESKVLPVPQYMRSKNPFWAIDAVITPEDPKSRSDSLWDKVILDANMANKHITSWIKNSWSSKCNIVAVNFFTGTNLIELAIYSAQDKYIYHREVNVCLKSSRCIW